MASLFVAASRLSVVQLLLRLVVPFALVLLAPLIIVPLLAVGALSTLGGATPAAAVGASPLLAVDGWSKPMVSYDLRRGFGHNPIAGCQLCSVNHKGQDLGHGCGAPIFAAATGEVVAAGPSGGGFGNWVKLNHGGGISTLYAHLADNSVQVAAGEQVAAGQQIGAEGTTGTSTGCHLHFEILLFGVPTDPAEFMAQRGLPF